MCAVVEEIRSTALLSSTNADQTHVYFTNMWSHHGIRLVYAVVYVGAGCLKLSVEGGGCVAITSQIASRESGMLFE